MTVFNKKIKVQSERIPTFHNVSHQVKEALVESGVENGICVVYSQHTSCSVIIQEFCHDRNYWGTELLMQDLVNVFEKIIPTCRTEGQYLHPGPEHIEFAAGNGEPPSWGLNTDAHLRSVILGRSESIPVIDGKLQMGEFGYIYLADFDQVRDRERFVLVQIVGE
jgi:secondary thiamine-phosphate synthase enzyme